MLRLLITFLLLSPSAWSQVDCQFLKKYCRKNYKLDESKEEEFHHFFCNDFTQEHKVNGSAANFSVDRDGNVYWLKKNKIRLGKLKAKEKQISLYESSDVQLIEGVWVEEEASGGTLYYVDLKGKRLIEITSIAPHGEESIVNIKNGKIRYFSKLECEEGNKYSEFDLGSKVANKKADRKCWEKYPRALNEQVRPLGFTTIYRKDDKGELLRNYIPLEEIQCKEFMEANPQLKGLPHLKVSPPGSI